MDTSRVTRFEVITADEGRVVSLLGVSVELALQDDGRTLKVFLEEGPLSASQVRQQMITEGEERDRGISGTRKAG